MTRPDDGGRFRRLLLEAGWDILHSPLTRVEPPADPDPLRMAARGLSGDSGVMGADVLLLTSARAVRALAAALGDEGSDPRSLVSGLEVWVVGSATGRAARNAGFAVTRMPETFHGDALVREAAGWRKLEGLRVWYPRSAEGRDAIPEGLRRAGATVRTVPAYRIAAWPEMVEKLVAAVRSGSVDAVPLTAGSAARALADGWAVSSRRPWPGSVRVVAIGPVTGDRARALGLPVHGTADPHTLPGLVECIRGLV